MDAPVAFALVEPRAISPITGELLPLVDLISEHLYSETQTIRITGDGKSVALSHLAAHFHDCDQVCFRDDEGTQPRPVEGKLIVFSSAANFRADLVLKLAGWTADDFIAYLIAKAPDRCKSVMSRLQKSNDYWLGNRSPLVITTMLDHLIEHDHLQSIADAIRFHFRPSVFEYAEQYDYFLTICENYLGSTLQMEHAMICYQIPDSLVRVFNHPPVRYVLAVDRIVERLAVSADQDGFQQTWSRSFLKLMVNRLQSLDDIHAEIRSLEKVVCKADSPVSTNAADILLRLDPQWRPPRASRVRLNRASLDTAEWNGLLLEKSSLHETRLRHASLNGASFNKSDLTSADFSFSQMTGVKLYGASARGARFSNVSMRHVDARRANLSHAIFDSARMEYGDFSQACLAYCDFSHSLMQFSRFESADLSDAKLDESDLSSASFDKARLVWVDFRRAYLKATRFVSANLSNCNFEETKLDEINFSKANCTGALFSESSFKHCNFVNANLLQAKLGNVNWTHCNLRGADMSGCHFFFGSTRSGLVGSPYPSHGTRTGFYTDDYDEQHFKRPEEIRKANLRGCDLRGAKVHRADFYLVDLRDASYDSDQERHFRRCGAILNG